MKVLGIEISGREVRIVALKNCSGEIKNYTGNYKPLKLEDDNVAENVRLFKNTLFATLDGFTPDVVVCKYLEPKGKYSASPISFKIEGLIQLYEKAVIHSTKPQTISAFFKKNELDISCDFKYQEDALKLGYHYLQVN